MADQLQTNYASDLRHVLQCVFECNASQDDDVTAEEEAPEKTNNIMDRAPLVDQTPATTADDVTPDSQTGTQDESTPVSPTDEATQGTFHS